MASFLLRWVVEVAGDGSEAPWPNVVYGKDERTHDESQAGLQGSQTLLALSSELPCPLQLSDLLTWALVSFLLVPIKHPPSPPSTPKP